jgi:hypothetical protein
MEKSGARQLAVVDRSDGNKLVGLLTMSDIVRAHARAAMEVSDPDQTDGQPFSVANETAESGTKI